MNSQPNTTTNLMAQLALVPAVQATVEATQPNTTTNLMAQLALVPAVQATVEATAKSTEGGILTAKSTEGGILTAIVMSTEGEILSNYFIETCRTVLPVLDKLGPSMAVIRSDIGGNIQRLEEICGSGKSEYKFLYEIVRKEAAEGTAKKPLSCTRAILWLTRAMDFSVVLLRDLMEQPEWSLKQAVEHAYNITLKQWHGWISAAAFKVGLKLIPEREKFIGLLEDMKGDTEKFISVLPPVLQENHKFLQSLRLDRLKSS